MPVAVHGLQQSGLRSDMTLVRDVVCSVRFTRHSCCSVRVLLERVLALTIPIRSSIPEEMQVVLVQHYLLVRIDRAGCWCENHFTGPPSVCLRLGRMCPPWWFLFDWAERFKLDMACLKRHGLWRVVRTDSLLVAGCHITALTELIVLICLGFLATLLSLDYVMLIHLLSEFINLNYGKFGCWVCCFQFEFDCDLFQATDLLI